MSDAYPTAQATAPVVKPYADNPTPVQQELSPEDTAAADLLYEDLKPQATLTAREYVLARTPAAMQEYMAGKIDADWPLPDPPV